MSKVWDVPPEVNCRFWVTTIHQCYQCRIINRKACHSGEDAESGKAVRVSGQRVYGKSMTRNFAWTQKPLKKKYKVHFLKSEGFILLEQSFPTHEITILFQKRAFFEWSVQSIIYTLRECHSQFMPPNGSLSRITEHVFWWWPFSLGWTHNR